MRGAGRFELSRERGHRQKRSLYRHQVRSACCHSKQVPRCLQGSRRLFSVGRFLAEWAIQASAPSKTGPSRRDQVGRSIGLSGRIGWATRKSTGCAMDASRSLPRLMSQRFASVRMTAFQKRAPKPVRSGRVGIVSLRHYSSAQPQSKPAVGLLNVSGRTGNTINDVRAQCRPACRSATLPSRGSE